MRHPPVASTIAPHPDRRAEPLDVLLPQTFRWLARLPHDIQPMELSRSFPRIANLLAANWAEPDAMRAYLDSLLVDRRGGRQGFSPSMNSELRDLHSFYQRLFPQPAKTPEKTSEPTKRNLRLAQLRSATQPGS